eukprot:4751269-Prymnesium_polylepis.1
MTTAGGESKVEGDGVGQAQGQASGAVRLHEVHRQALDSARKRGEPASALLARDADERTLLPAGPVRS